MTVFVSRRRLAQLGVGLLAASTMAVFAQDSYPTKPVRIVVGFSAGGTTDVVARIMAKELTERLGQPFVVENRPGGGSNIATEAVKAAQPDGYTLLFVAVTSAINQTLYPNVKFDLNRDFDAVALGAKVPNILVVHPSVPVNNVPDFIEWARANNDKIAYASSGSGTSIHMAAEMFKVRTGLKTQHIPYKGGSPSLSDLMAGQLDVIFSNFPESIPFVKAGKLRAIAIATDQRNAQVPEVPTTAEAGMPKLNVEQWTAVMVPAATPDAVVNTLSQALVQIMQIPEVVARSTELGFRVDPKGPAEFAQFWNAEVQRWSEVIQAAGITAD